METSRTIGRTIYTDGKELLFFSGYGYLGMNQVPAFTALVKEGLDLYGLNFPSSRISNTRLTLFEAMEQLLSAITGQEATVCYASGFSAGTAAASLLPGDVQVAPGSHPAVNKGQAPNMPFTQWADGIRHSISEATHPMSFIADAVNIFTPAINDLSFLQDCGAGSTLLVDDSHGIGITGDRGEGVSGRLPNGVNNIISYSLSKGLNLIGGAVSCTTQMAVQLRTMPEYTAATSLSPAYIHAFIKGQELYALQREKLRKNIVLFTQMAAGIAGIRSCPSLPIFVLPAGMDEARLKREGIVISSFAYPDPSGAKVNRAIINALHTEEDLERLATALTSQ